MIAQLGQLRAGGQIENTDFRLLTADGQQFAVGTEGQTLHGQMAVVEDAQQLAAGHAPQANGLIGGAGRQIVAIRMERNRLRMKRLLATSVRFSGPGTYIHVLGVAHICVQWKFALGVPQAGGQIARSRRQIRIDRTLGQTPDGILMAAIDCRRTVAVRQPGAHVAIFRHAEQQSRLLAREQHTGDATAVAAQDALARIAAR